MAGGSEEFLGHGVPGVAAEEALHFGVVEGLDEQRGGGGAAEVPVDEGVEGCVVEGGGGVGHSAEEGECSHLWVRVWNSVGG